MLAAPPGKQADDVGNQNLATLALAAQRFRFVDALARNTFLRARDLACAHPDVQFNRPVVVAIVEIDSLLHGHGAIDRS